MSTSQEARLRPVKQETKMTSPIQNTSAHNPHFLRWIAQRQIGIASFIMVSIVVLHNLHPYSRFYTTKILNLSYASIDGTYKQGFDDLYFVLGWLVNFMALRAITIDWILRPVAGYLAVPKKSRLRFAEQGWLVLYYGIFWTLGMYLWIGSDYWLDNKAIWAIWPAREMSGPFKWYNLVQLAFWLEQILVIHMEKRRKDHAQMLTHHIITCILITITYAYRYTRAANVVLCLMDVVDFLLPLAKILRYVRQEKACNAVFALFVITWLLARHVLYLQLCYDIYNDVPGPDTMVFGCYSGSTYERLPNLPAQPDYFAHLLWPVQDAEGVICLNGEVKWIFLGMLCFLQALSMIWFCMILNVVAGILMGKKAEDTRSEDEGSDEDIVEEKDIIRKKQMDVTDLNICVSGNDGVSRLVSTHQEVSSLNPRPTTTRRRPGLLEKELLARIGCENPQ